MKQDTKKNKIKLCTIFQLTATTKRRHTHTHTHTVIVAITNKLYR